MSRATSRFMTNETSYHFTRTNFTKPSRNTSIIDDPELLDEAKYKSNPYI
jgi:hypothetical protein